MIEYGLIFFTGLLSSMHCVGMCGVVVLAYSTQTTAPDSNNGWKLHAAYNGGRILSYAVLGAIVGLAGMMLTTIQNFASILSIVGGAIMIFAGIAMLGIIPLPSRISLSNNPSGFRKMYAPLLLKKTVASKLLLGTLTPLLPCGLLYAMVAKAATAGSLAHGALTMATFGAGMAPSLMILGSISSMFSSRFRKGAERIAALSVILMGVILILRGMHVPFLGIMAGQQTCPACEGE